MKNHGPPHVCTSPPPSNFWPVPNQTSKDRSIMVLLRHFVLSTLKYNILFRAKHIAGCINRESDALSRLQVENSDY